MNVGVLPLGISFYLLVSHPISHIKEKKEIEWKGNQKIKEFPEGFAHRSHFSHLELYGLPKGFLSYGEGSQYSRGKK